MLHPWDLNTTRFFMYDSEYSRFTELNLKDMFSLQSCQNSPCNWDNAKYGRIKTPSAVSSINSLYVRILYVAEASSRVRSSAPPSTHQPPAWAGCISAAQGTVQILQAYRKLQSKHLSWKTYHLKNTTLDFPNCFLAHHSQFSH